MGEKVVLVLLSSGRHPVTGRTCAADCDARAARLALRLQRRGWSIIAVHAGQPEDAALSEYLGMGLSTIVVLGPLDETGDAVPLLVDVAKRYAPTLVLCGQVAEVGEGSGMVPYLVAEALKLPVIANVTDVLEETSGFRVLRAEPGGRRRQFLCKSAVLAVGGIAESPPPYAYGRMRRGSVALRQMPSAQDWQRVQWKVQAARARPIRLDAVDVRGEKNYVVSGVTPAQAAAEIISFLEQVKVLKPQATSDADEAF